jgi:hypothetical protein
MNVSERKELFWHISRELLDSNPEWTPFWLLSGYNVIAEVLTEAVLQDPNYKDYRGYTHKVALYDFLRDKNDHARSVLEDVVSYKDYGYEEKARALLLILRYPAATDEMLSLPGDSLMPCVSMVIAFPSHTWRQIRAMVDEDIDPDIIRSMQAGA